MLTVIQNLFADHKVNLKMECYILINREIIVIKLYSTQLCCCLKLLLPKD